jgi:hypothetical protein
VTGYQTFAAAGVANTDEVRYVIEDGSDWEIGTGTYTASGTTLTRSVDESSNSGSPLNLTGNAVIFVSASSDEIVQPGDNVSVLTNDAGYTTNTGTVTSVGLTAGTGISVSGGPITSSGSITVTNSAPDQVVSLSQGANVTITGTYPSFTIAATDTNTTYSAGNGIGLSGTTFSVAAGTGLAQETSGLALTGQALALHNLATNGMIARTASNTVTARTLTGTTDQIAVTNGDGVSGNPTLSLPSAIAVPGAVTASAADDGTKSSGTYTPAPSGGNFKRIVNGGAFTLAAPTATGDYTLLIQVTNNGSAGAVTFSGFSKVVGDDLTTTNADDFFIAIEKCNGFTRAVVGALQ